MLKDWKLKIIKFIANGEPVLLNWHINPNAFNEGAQVVVYIPPKNHGLSSEELQKMGILTPINHE